MKFSIPFFSPLFPGGVRRNGRLWYRDFSHSGQHASNREYLPPAAECAPSGVDVPTAGAEARSEGGTCSLQVVRTLQGPKRDCHNGIYACVDDSSLSSASAAKKLREERARRHALCNGRLRHASMQPWGREGDVSSSS